MDVVVAGGGQAGLAAGHHLRRRGLGHVGRVATSGTLAVGEPRLHLPGYGDWTGPASATLVGVGRPAREAARQIARQRGL